MNYTRKEHELPLATEKWGWKYHHIGIPVKEPIPGEKYIPHLKFYVKGFDTSPFGIEYMRFEDDSPFDELIKTVPHLAFVVPNIEEAIKDFEILNEINSPMIGLKVAMIKHNGAPIELMEFKRGEF